VRRSPGSHALRLRLRPEPKEINVFRRLTNSGATLSTLASTQDSIQEGRIGGRHETIGPGDAARQIFLVSCFPAFLIVSWEAAADQSDVDAKNRLQGSRLAWQYHGSSTEDESSADYADFRRLEICTAKTICENLRNLWIALSRERFDADRAPYEVIQIRGSSDRISA
jgi:hypothetical protein